MSIKGTVELTLDALRNALADVTGKAMQCIDVEDLFRSQWVAAGAKPGDVKRPEWERKSTLTSGHFKLVITRSLT